MAQTSPVRVTLTNNGTISPPPMLDLSDDEQTLDGSQDEPQQSHQNRNLSTRSRDERAKLVYLEEVHDSLRDIDKISFKLYHVFGIFKFAETLGKATHIWNLIDETCPDGLKIVLRGSHQSYPKPMCGDIVRIHRLRISTGHQYPECPDPRNIVIWRSFCSADASHESIARSPTIKPEDIERRKRLESYLPYTKISDIGSRATDHIDIAGKVVRANSCDGRYKNYVVQIMDGSQRVAPFESYYHDLILNPDGQEINRMNTDTCTVTIKIYSKQTLYDTEEHIKVAMSLRPGDFVYMSNIKMLRSGDKIKLELGSNHKFGKCIRRVDPSSKFGEILSANLAPLDADLDEDRFSDDSSQTTEIYPNIDPNGPSNDFHGALEQERQAQMDQVQNLTHSTMERRNSHSDDTFNETALSNQECDHIQPVAMPPPTMEQTILETRPTFKLNEVVRLLREKDTDRLVDIFGIFMYEECAGQAFRIWRLMDESCPEGIKIRLVGFYQPFPKALNGDVIRIHRLQIKYGLAYPECAQPANIVVWEGFQDINYSSNYKCGSRTTTITQDDLQRKLYLEQFFTCTRIEEIGPSTSNFISLAGKIIAKNLCDDRYGNFLLQLFDGSKFRTPIQCAFKDLIEPKPNEDGRILDNSIVVKIYSRQTVNDTDAHVNMARSLNVDDIAYISNVKVTWINGKVKFELSSNLAFGKCIRKVDKRSVFGERISREVDILSFNEVEMALDGSYEDNVSLSPTMGSNSIISNYEDCIST